MLINSVEIFDRFLNMDLVTDNSRAHDNEGEESGKGKPAVPHRSFVRCCCQSSKRIFDRGRKEDRCRVPCWGIGYA